jgi:hypothetical protein
LVITNIQPLLIGNNQYWRFEAMARVGCGLIQAMGVILGQFRNG